MRYLSKTEQRILFRLMEASEHEKFMDVTYLSVKGLMEKNIKSRISFDEASSLLIQAGLIRKRKSYIGKNLYKNMYCLTKIGKQIMKALMPIMRE